MQRTYRYKLDKRSKRLTLIFTLLIVGLGVFISYYSASGYFSAWFVLFAAAFLALFILSIPRFVKIDDDSLEIHCIVELTHINIEDIKSVRKIDRHRMRYCIPLLGSYGFFGYYGYYFNLAEMSLVKVYASRWKNFVMIEDIYDDTYIINCDDADEFVHFANKARRARLMLQGKPI